MHIEDYQVMSKRTLNKDLTRRETISNMAMGVAGESGEIIDAIKKYMYQGHILDIAHIEEEIGDVMFYICNLANVLGIDMGEALEKNYNKLLKRFPNGFSEEDSIKRLDKQ